MDERISQIYQGIINGDRTSVVESIKEAMDEGLPAEEILNEGMVSAMTQVGKLFEDGEYYVPEMLISARAMKAGMELLKPALVSANVSSKGKVVAGTVHGDLHDIGKHLVCMMLEGASFEVIDLGADVSPEKFVEAIRSSGASMVAMSALLTTTMLNMKSTIEAIKAAGLRDQVKIMVGGAPLSQKFANEIGADGYAPDASRAVTLAKELAKG